MTDVLQRIVADKRNEVAVAKEKTSPKDMADRAADAGPPRDFFGAMTRSSDRVRVIAEIKRASPSAGLIRPDFNPVAIARAYEAAGAKAISCVTDKPYFQGDLAFLGLVKQATDLPVLRKDFIIDPYQVDEARAAGADAILLIAECLDSTTVLELIERALQTSMAVLLETYERRNLLRVVQDVDLAVTAPRGGAAGILLGVNNRNLRTMNTDVGHTLEVMDLVAEPNRFVSESGIRTHADIVRLWEAGVHSVLVGEHLMRQADVGAALLALMEGG